MNEVVHHVKRMGESEYTDCGIKFINTFNVATQEGEVSCTKCLEESKGGEDA